MDSPGERLVDRRAGAELGRSVLPATLGTRATLAVGAALALALAGNASAPSVAGARTVEVRAHQPIAAACLQLAPGDTLRLGPGTYEESIEIPSGVSLVGAGIGRTVITQPRGNAIAVHSAGVPTSIGYLTIRDASTGILIEGGSPLLSDLRIEDCLFFGVTVGDSSRAQILRTMILQSGVGMLVINGSEPRIGECQLRGNKVGLRIEGASPVISGSEIRANDIGILVLGRSRPVIGDRPGGSNRIHQNRLFNVRNESGERVEARYNFWGDTRCRFVRGFEGPILYQPFMNLALEDSLWTCP